MATKDSVKKVDDKSFSKNLRGVKSEFRKVVWPTKKQILNYTGIVIAASIAFSVLLKVFDEIVILILKTFIY